MQQGNISLSSFAELCPEYIDYLKEIVKPYFEEKETKGELRNLHLESWIPSLILRDLKV
jgi:hypothetical protein